MNILNFLRREQNGELKAMVSCYDHRSTKTLNKNNLDMLRVRDNPRRLVHGLCSAGHAMVTRNQLDLAERQFFYRRCARNDKIVAEKYKSITTRREG